jgi:hypothetical protein
LKQTASTAQCKPRDSTPAGVELRGTVRQCALRMPVVHHQTVTKEVRHMAEGKAQLEIQYCVA